MLGHESWAVFVRDPDDNLIGLIVWRERGNHRQAARRFGFSMRGVCIRITRRPEGSENAVHGFRGQGRSLGFSG
jgi:hypothetical protein